LGESYSVQVLSSPRGTSCQLVSGGTGLISAALPEPVIVRCDDLPEHQLTYLLTGLSSGRSLELINREDGQRFEISTADVNAEGQGTLPLYVRTGGAYELYITRQPLGLSCTLTRGVGAMSEGGVPEALQPLISCQSLPSFELSFPVMGLSPGESVTATLSVSREGEAPLQSQSVYLAPEDIGSASGLTTSISFPELRLYQGDRYQLSVDSVSTPNDSCVVENTLEPGVSEVSFNAQLLSPPLAIQCQRDVEGQELYEISGRLEGVDMEGVKLSLNGSPDLLRLDPSSEEFRFEGGLPDDTSYTVTVARTPDFKRCSVTNGVGRITGADVSDLVVRCVDAGQLHVNFNLPSFEGSQVRLQLYSRPQGNVSARLVGEEQGELEVVDGSASSPVVAAGGGANEPIKLAVGDYHLYAQVNSNNSFDQNSNEPTFGIGDLGYYLSVRVTAGEVSYVNLDQAQGLPVMPVIVIGVAPDNVDLDEDSALEAPMTCVFSPQGTFVSPPMRLPSPNQSNAPIVGVATRYCVSDCELPDDSYITNKPAFLALPATAAYDLACFVDFNGSEGRDAGDLVYTGVVSAISAYAPITVPLTVHP